MTGARFAKIGTDAATVVVTKLGKFHACVHYNDSALDRLLTFTDGTTVFAKILILAGQTQSIDYGAGGRPMTGIVSGDTKLTVTVLDAVTGLEPASLTGVTDVLYS